MLGLKVLSVKINFVAADTVDRDERLYYYGFWEMLLLGHSLLRNNRFLLIQFPRALAITARFKSVKLQSPSHTNSVQPGLDIRLVDAVARGASRFENLLAPQKTYWPPKKLTGPFPKTKLVR